ncbi:MAG: hypothetical protein KTQ49_00830 [Candidatus Omnitrophica bacterium]|nr:hypothetical protein [Candidatus Omnitrophota bacterium]
MIGFWGEGFLRGLVRGVFFILIILFCWGWIVHVGSGKMTTPQYLRKLAVEGTGRVTAGGSMLRETWDRFKAPVEIWGGPHDEGAFGDEPSAPGTRRRGR